MRKRRSQLKIDYLKCQIYYLLKEDAPMTCRQIYYRMVSAGLIDKTVNEYTNTTCRLLVNMRRSGEIPYGWIADNTRWMRKPQTFSSMESALVYTAQTSRRALWDTQDY